MRFSRVLTIGTLVAAVMALLVILPATAREGVDFARTDGDNFLRVTVQGVNDAGNGYVPKDTRLGSTFYVSNQTSMKDSDEITDVTVFSDPPTATELATVGVQGNGVIEEKSGFATSEIQSVGYSRVEILVERDETPAAENDADTGQAARNKVIKVTSDSGRSPVILATDASNNNLTGHFYVIEPVSSGTAPNGGVVMVDNDRDGGDDTTGTAPTPAQSVSTIEARDGDTITITADGNTLRLVVDGEAPVISDVAPRSGALQSSSNVGIGFTVTDNVSGLRTDLEDPSGAMSADDGVDADGVLNEPLSILENPDLIGSTEDINMEWRVKQTPALGYDQHVERRGDRNWIEEEKDYSYSTSFTIAGLNSAVYEWQVTATDRVGNTATSDSKASSPDKADPFTVAVDNRAPEAARVFAGIGFNTAKGAERKDASSILLVFNNEDSTDLDALDASTIDVDDFNVVGNTVASVIHPNEKIAIDKGRNEVGDEVSPHVDDNKSDTVNPVNDDRTDLPNVAGDGMRDVYTEVDAYKDETCDTHSGYDASSGQAIEIDSNPKGCIDTRNRVYLVLGTPLGDDETPDIHIAGTVRDKAGNAAALTDNLESEDRISPTITVGVSGDVAGADGRPLAREEMTVNVAAGERLSRAPTVWLVSFDHTGKIVEDAYDSSLGSADGENAWEVSFDGPATLTRVAAVIVSGEDRRENVTSTDGWTDKNGNGMPDVGEQLDLAELDDEGLLVEFDDSIPDADVTLSPDASSNNQLKTESSNPFIRLSFTEGKENTVLVGAVREAKDATDDADAVTALPDKDKDSYLDGDGVVTKFDSYGGVELTDVTLDDVDVTDEVERLSSSSFDLALYGLAVGDHVLKFTATDAAGNAITDEEVKFEVLPRSAYEIDLRPDWNLVSLPGEPIDSAIDSVLPADSQAIEVLTYEAGLWIASTRELGQPWEGDVTDIDGQHAYWIRSTKSDTLATVLIEPGTAVTQPPAFPLIVGWNLIPVTDLDQGPAGKTMHGDYFTSMPEEDFVRAYVFNSQTRRWERLGYRSSVSNGQGVWVYSRSNVVLVP